jgi:iron complex transport system ATP-binding protein
MTILETKQLTIGYRANRQDNIIAENLNLALNAGELVCLLGQNGVGKSTLMRTLSAMQAPISGQVFLGGDDISTLKGRELAQRLSIVTTERVEVGLMTGASLVALGRHPHTDWTGQLTAHDERMVQWALHSVGAQSLAGRKLSEMSDGERQRVLIARALAQEPAVILLDEPTAFLDLPRRIDIMQVLRQLAHSTQKAILLSTHDLDLALKTADSIWLMTGGSPIAIGMPEELVLDGAFERAFAREGLQFDAWTGSFVMSRPNRGVIQVVGSGLRYEWTKRALERVGFRVGESECVIQVLDDAWLTATHRYESLRALLEVLEV